MKKKIINEQYRNWFSREAPVKVDSAKDDSMIVSGVLATEQPVIVFDWATWEPVREILLMKGANIPENGQVPLLDSHSRYSTSQIKGSTRNIEQGKDDKGEPILLADYHFEREAKRDYNLVKDKHLTDTSIGYRTYDEFTIKVGAKESIEIDGKTYRNEYGDDLALLIRTRWDLKENSLVAIGADDRAKFRSQFVDDNGFLIKNEPEVSKEEFTNLKSTIEEMNKSLTNIISKGEIKMDDEKKELTREEILKAERTRVQEIESLGKKHNIDVSELIKNGSAIEVARGFILEKIGDKPLETPPDFVDLDSKQQKQYSYARAINFLLEPDKFRDSATLEREYSEQVTKNMGGKAPKGIYVMQRDMSVGLASNYGSDLVGTNHLGSSMIELLRNKMLLFKLGAKPLSGLVGNVSIPKWASGATAGWSATEGAGTSESTPGTSALTLSPKEISANVDYTRQLFLQSDPSIDMLIKDDIAKQLAIGIDLAGFHGTGADGQPQGLVGTSGVGSTTIASVSLTKMLGFESDIEVANVESNNLNFVTTPAVKAALKAKDIGTDTGQMLCSLNNICIGYPMYSSNQISSGYILFGDFGQIIVGEWGGLDLFVDRTPRTGIVTVTAFKTVDIGVRQPGAFSVGSSFSV